MDVPVEVSRRIFGLPHMTASNYEYHMRKLAECLSEKEQAEYASKIF